MNPLKKYPLLELLFFGHLHKKWIKKLSTSHMYQEELQLAPQKSSPHRGPLAETKVIGEAKIHVSGRG